MTPRLPAALLLPLLLAPAVAAGGCASTGADGGKPTAEEERTAAALFEKGTALREEANWDDARDTFRELFEDYPASPLAAEAQFQAAECAYGAERYYAAGQAFAKYIEDRPLSPRVDLVEKRMYDIGEYLIEDGKRGLWGTGVFTTSSEGVEVLRRLATLLPTGSYADDALMRIGRYYAEDRDFVGAEATLEELLKSYPASEWRLEARFLLAWTYRRDNRGPEYDGEKLRKARAHFRAFLELTTAHPDLAAEYAERVAAAREEVAAIEGDLARKALARAGLYRRMDRPRAALFVLEDAAARWGATDAGRECARQAAALASLLGGTPETAVGPPGSGEASE